MMKLNFLVMAIFGVGFVVLSAREQHDDRASETSQAMKPQLTPQVIAVANVVNNLMHLDVRENECDTPTKLSQCQYCFALDVIRLLIYMNNQDYKFTFGEAMRSREQAEIYAAKGIGLKNSLHCKRLAIDINLFDQQGNYLTTTESHRIFGEYWESLHPANKWGGNSEYGADGNHYERREPGTY